MRQGLTQPLNPAAGPSFLHPSCIIYKRFSAQKTAFLVKGKCPTGKMKILKKVGWESISLRPFFMFSPDALHPAGGGTPPSPWASSFFTHRDIVISIHDAFSGERVKG